MKENINYTLSKKSDFGAARRSAGQRGAAFSAATAMINSLVYLFLTRRAPTDFFGAAQRGAAQRSTAQRLVGP